MEEILYKVISLKDDPLPNSLFGSHKQKPKGFMAKLLKDIIELESDQALMLIDSTPKDILRLRTNCIWWFKKLDLPYVLEILSIKTITGCVYFTFKRITKRIDMELKANGTAPMAELADATDLKFVSS